MKPDPNIVKTLSLVDPCPEHWMEMENPQWSICQVLREIWQRTDNPEIKTRARIAVTMAKKMQAKLIKYDPIHKDIWKDTDTMEMRNKLA